MAFTTIAASQTDADSIVDQTLMDAIRTDLDDLNSRVNLFTVDNLHDHFNWNPDSSTRSFETNGLTAGNTGYGKDWIFYSDLANPTGARNGAKADPSSARMSVPATTNTYSRITSKRNFKQSLITYPLTFEARCKISAYGASGEDTIRIGLVAGIFDENPTTLHNLITFASGGTTNWKGSCYDGTLAATADFAPPTVNTWFVAKIVVTSSVLCEFFIDGVSKGTVTTHIPTSEMHVLIAAIAGPTGVAANFDLDYVDCYSAAVGLSP